MVVALPYYLHMTKCWQRRGLHAIQTTASDSDGRKGITFTCKSSGERGRPKEGGGEVIGL